MGSRFLLKRMLVSLDGCVSEKRRTVDWLEVVEGCCG